ncbi:MAG: class I SAM-dependent methyltransferase [Planctomycetes bacterium]|nr:class I SAM-dependent methyltransferase [Planctomycetota bacterium]
MAPSFPIPRAATYERDLACFRRAEREVQEFWRRLGGRPDFTGARVLELGCGRGALAIEIARAGAAKVMGLDVNAGRIRFAREHLLRERPELEGRVDLRCQRIEECEEGGFHVAVTKDTLEHVMNLEGTLREIARRLLPRGRLYAGFGPLYTSPYGDHDRRRVILAPWGAAGRVLARVPWLHLALEPVLVRLHNREGGSGGPMIASLRDLGLNKLGFSGYLAALEASGLGVVKLETNRSWRRLSRLLAALSRVPGLRDYCVHNVYCVLERS